MSKWKKCFVYEHRFSGYSGYYIDADNLKNITIADIKKAMNLDETEEFYNVKELYYDSDNWVIKNFKRSDINGAYVTSYFSYLYNSDKPEYPIKDTSYPVYVAFEDTTKIGRDFVLDLSNFHYTGESCSFNPSGMFYSCPAGEIVGLDSLPSFYMYSLVFYNLPNIRNLKLRDLECRGYKHRGIKSFSFCENTQRLCCNCPSLESIDMSYLSFEDNGYESLPAFFENYDKELLCGDWDREENRLTIIYKQYNKPTIPFREKKW